MVLEDCTNIIEKKKNTKAPSPAHPGPQKVFNHLYFLYVNVAGTFCGHSGEP